MAGTADRRAGRAARRRPWRWLVRLALAGAGVLALWGGGFLWFAAQLPDAVAAPERRTEAIVVLTGGSGRVGRGLELLEQGRADKLFVSGVHRGVDVAELLRVSQRAPERLACCVALGHAAETTEGNAVETAQWMQAQGYRSLRLVTAAYHMPRSLLEFRRRMPAVEIVPHPVFPEHVKHEDWWRWPGSTALLIGEYSKYLVARLRAALAGPPAALHAGETASG
jgi:uncharacterized SAM-binding protein YcdF (DUF218 family)